MITLYQHPVSPFCITTEAILKYAKAERRVENLPTYLSPNLPFR